MLSKNLLALKMYIRINKTPNSPRKSIQIVESIRQGDKVRQKIVRYVGIAMDDREEQKLKDMANEIIAKITAQREKDAAQQSLFDASSESEILNHVKSKAGRPKRKNIEDILPPSQVSLDDIKEESRIVEGVHDIAGAMFNDMYSGLLESKRAQNRLRDVVLSRLVYQ